MMNDNGVIEISAAAYSRAIDALAGEIAGLRARLAVTEALLYESAADRGFDRGSD